MQKTSSGFTLLELIIVMVLIGILAIGGYLSWPGLALNVDAQALQVASDIRYAQMLAMSKAQRVRFVETSSTSYQLLDSSGNALINSRGGTSTTLGTGITFGVFTNLPNNLINFDGSGTPYVDTGTPGTPLTVTATIPLTSSGGTETISISPQTGRVTF